MAIARGGDQPKFVTSPFHFSRNIVSVSLSKNAVGLTSSGNSSRTDEYKPFFFFFFFFPHQFCSYCVPDVGHLTHTATLMSMADRISIREVVEGLLKTKHRHFLITSPSH